MTSDAGFDAGYRRWRASRVHAELLGVDMPAAMKPFSFVPIDGLSEVAGFLATGPGQTLVDLGCGRGGPGTWLAARTGARLIGVDSSRVAIDDAVGDVFERRATFGDPSDAEFRVADVAATGLPTDCADAVVAIDVLQLLDDPAAMLCEAARLLRPGGRLVATTWEGRGDAPLRFPRHLPALVRQAGLQPDVCAERPDWLRRQRLVYRRAAAGPEPDPAVRDLVREGSRWQGWCDDVRRVVLRAHSTR